MANKDHWIKGAVKHPGALHEDLGIPKDKKIPLKKLHEAAKEPGVVGKRAQLAETFHHMDAKRKKGSPADEETHNRLKNAAIVIAGGG
jgi:hypothetical protein